MQSDHAQLCCPLCSQIHSCPQLALGQRAKCVRCGTAMAERSRLGPDAALFFALTGLLLAVPSLLLPFVTLEKFGNRRISFLTDGFMGFWLYDFGPLASWVLFCGVIAPFGLLVLLLAIFWTDRHEALDRWNRRFRRLAYWVGYWAMPEVQVLGVLVAFFKLGDVVDVSVGPGLWCYGLASLFTLLAWGHFHLQRPAEHASDVRHGNNPDRAPVDSGIGPSAAFAIGAVIMLSPAYALPVMHLGTAGKASSDPTIFSGIVQLWQEGLGGLAAIVFTASFLVPLLKLAGLAVLLVAARYPRENHSGWLLWIYRTIDMIGRWSQLDVFLVAFLCGAVRFGKLAYVQPRGGAIAFASVVVLTMLATRRFNPSCLFRDSPTAASRITHECA